ncbi:hypothetical protein OC834_007822, partial [Tilletia horrida]
VCELDLIFNFQKAYAVSAKLRRACSTVCGLRPERRCNGQQQQGEQQPEPGWWDER